jgi:excisionase family DNA binding protein
MPTPLKTIQIVSSPNVLGGKPCIEGHRISVQQIVEFYKYERWSMEELEQTLGLRPAEVHAALAYYFDHQDEIETAIRENDDEFEEDDELYDADKFLNFLNSYLSTKQAAKQLGISERRVRQLIDDGRLSAKKVGVNWFIHPSSLEVESIKNRKSGRPASKS